MALTFHPPSTQRVFDACVIGSQLGGVVAGALLAKRGYRVLHVDHDGLGPTYEDQGWLLPHGPLLMPSPRLLPAAEIALQELGLLTDVQRALEPSAPDLQLILPRARLELARDPVQRAAELAREWPADAARIEAALADLHRRFEAISPFLRALPPLPASGLLERWRLSRARRTSGAPGQAPPPLEEAPLRELADHPLGRALQVVARFLGYLDGELPPLSAVRLLGAVLRGGHRLPGGVEGLRETVRRKIAESRGELLGSETAPAIASGLELDGHRIASVRVAGSHDAFTARVFLAATDAMAVRRLLPEAERTGRRARPLQEMRVHRQVATLNWVLLPGGLPPGLGETAICLPSEGGESEAVLLQTQPARRSPGKGEKRDGTVVLTAATFLPAAARDQGESGLAAWAASIRASVSELLPFFEGHVLLESMPLLAAPRERRGSRLMPHPLYEVGLPRTLGVTGLPTRSPWKNLIFAGREVVPGLGVEGEFHAGLQAAAAAERLLGKKDRPR
ncbi:MAG: phytoene dehydrogenase [Deltaproteobacteria bacterium]|nr:phytoene dehydrogenase [Deltaproteobacteria bacterium]